MWFVGTGEVEHQTNSGYVIISHDKLGKLKCGKLSSADIGETLEFRLTSSNTAKLRENDQAVPAENCLSIGERVSVTVEYVNEYGTPSASLENPSYKIVFPIYGGQLTQQITGEVTRIKHFDGSVLRLSLTSQNDSANDTNFAASTPSPSEKQQSGDEETSVPYSSDDVQRNSDSQSPSPRPTEPVKSQNTREPTSSTTSKSDGTNENVASANRSNTVRRIRNRAEKAASENSIKNPSPTREQKYVRSDAVRRYAKERASGVCEGCNEPAPFQSVTGEPYLEVHHVDELAGGGSDSPDKVIALCPTCHRRVHYGDDGDNYNQRLKRRVEEELSHVGRSSQE